MHSNLKLQMMHFVIHLDVVDAVSLFRDRCRRLI